MGHGSLQPVCFLPSIQLQPYLKLLGLFHPKNTILIQLSRINLLSSHMNGEKYDTYKYIMLKSKSLKSYCPLRCLDITQVGRIDR